MDNIKIINNPPPNWGGARPGSGRKPTGRAKKTLWVTDEELKKLREFLEKLRG